MQPIDKFGRKLYPAIYSTLQRHGRRLEHYGYREARETPNLLFMSYSQITFFADMRGTEEIPIWKVPVPLLYWNRTKGSEPYVLGYETVAALVEVCRLQDIPLRLIGDGCELVDCDHATELVNIINTRLGHHRAVIDEQIKRLKKFRSRW